MTKQRGRIKTNGGMGEKKTKNPFWGLFWIDKE